jgi:predicted HAD superfamily Cof-like phosphohydrolase
MSDSKIKKVLEFNRAFNLPIRTQPSLIPPAESRLLIDMMREENQEYSDAVDNGDIIEIADALTDQLYLNIGNFIRHGLGHKIEELFAEVNRSNMSKLDENGKPIYKNNGKVEKSDQYFEPNIKGILNC